MKLLPKTVPSLRLRITLQVVFSLAVVVGLVALELSGRQAANDVQDSLNAFLLLGLVSAVSLWHRKHRLGWVNGLIASAQRMGRRLRNAKCDHGIDFRGTPNIPSRLPWVAYAVVFALLAIAALGFTVWYWLPGGWRSVISTASYVVYLVCFLVEWILLLALLLSGLFLPILRLDHHVQATWADHDRRILTLFTGLAYITVVTLVSALVPVIFPVVLLGVALVAVVVATMLAQPKDIAILWRYKRSRAIYSIPLVRLIGLLGTVLVLLAIAAVAWGRNGRMMTNPESSDVLSLTASLAGLAAWASPGLLVLALLRLREERRQNPAERTPFTLHLANKLAASAANDVRALFRSWGWRVCKTREAKQLEHVRIELVHPELSEATDYQPNWPLKLSPADLKNPLVKDRLKRRDEIQLRRRIFRGLNQILKAAGRGRRYKGGGFWLAPHWWFITGLGREESTKSRRQAKTPSVVLRRIGPSYHRAFGERPRQQLHAMLRAVQVDVIYIEDGVPLKSIVKVFRQMFELFDVHDGQRVVDDHTFRGIPKVRAVIHEFSPFQPYESVESYNQPKFDELSRGRVLHLFRDKGEQEELIEAPMDFDSVPSPMLVG